MDKYIIAIRNAIINMFIFLPIIYLIMYLIIKKVSTLFIKQNDVRLYKKAVKILKKTNNISIPYLQQQLKIDYDTAVKLIEKAKKNGEIIFYSHNRKSSNIDDVLYKRLLQVFMEATKHNNKTFSVVYLQKMLKMQDDKILELIHRAEKEKIIRLDAKGKIEVIRQYDILKSIYYWMD